MKAILLLFLCHIVTSVLVGYATMEVTVKTRDVSEEEALSLAIEADERGTIGSEGFFLGGEKRSYSIHGAVVIYFVAGMLALIVALVLTSPFPGPAPPAADVPGGGSRDKLSPGPQAVPLAPAGPGNPARKPRRRGKSGPPVLAAAQIDHQFQGNQNHSPLIHHLAAAARPLHSPRFRRFFLPLPHALKSDWPAHTSAAIPESPPFIPNKSPRDYRDAPHPFRYARGRRRLRRSRVRRSAGNHGLSNLPMIGALIARPGKTLTS